MRLAALEKWDASISKKDSLNLKHAANPTDIQHQNLKIRGPMLENLHKFLTFLLIIILMVFVVVWIVIVKRFFQNYSQPLKRLNCAVTFSQYGESLPDLFTTRFANDENYFNEPWPPQENDYNRNIATWYCAGYLKSRNHTIITSQISADASMYKGIDFADPDDPSQSYYEKCDKQVNKINTMNYFSYGSTISIVAINSLIRKIIIYLI